MSLTRQERIELLRMASNHNMGHMETIGRAKIYEEYLLKAEAVPESPKAEEPKGKEAKGQKRADTVSPFS